MTYNVARLLLKYFIFSFTQYGMAPLQSLTVNVRNRFLKKNLVDFSLDFRLSGNKMCDYFLKLYFLRNLKPVSLPLPHIFWTPWCVLSYVFGWALSWPSACGIRHGTTHWTAMRTTELVHHHTVGKYYQKVKFREVPCTICFKKLCFSKNYLNLCGQEDVCGVKKKIQTNFDSSL